MIEIKADAYNGTKEQPLPIGRMGEKLARTIMFDISSLKETYGEGTWNIVFQRPGLDESPYDVSNKWTNSEGYACWDVDRSDTGVFGYGKVELRYYPTALNFENNNELSKIYKSKIWITYTEYSLGEDGSVPSPYSDLVDIISDLRNKMLQTYAEFEAVVDRMLNPDWAETDSSVPTFIRNKPYIPQYPSDVGALAATLKGSPNGVAELDENGFVKSSQLPSYIDDILEFDTISEFPSEGEAGKIYLSTDTNTIYRWSGSSYVAIPVGLSLGTTSETAFRGDHGQIAYNHALSQHFSGSYTDLTDKPTIGNGTVSIKKGGTLVDSFNLNDTANKDINIPAQVQSDWNGSDTSSPAYILNKPDMSYYGKVRIVTAAEYEALSTADKNSDTLYFIKDSGGAWLVQTIDNNRNTVPSSKVLYDIYQTIAPQDLTNKLTFVQTFTPHDWGCKLYKRGGYYWFWINITWDTQPSGNVITVDDQYIVDISGPANSSASLNWNAMSNNGVQIHLFLRNAGIQINGFNSSNFTANDGIREWIVFPDCLPTITS